MLKFEWPLIVPDDADVKALAASTYDIDEYVVDIAKKEGLTLASNRLMVTSLFIKLVTVGHRTLVKNQLKCLTSFLIYP